jgi:cell division protease FtsH
VFNWYKECTLICCNMKWRKVKKILKKKFKKLRKLWFRHVKDREFFVILLLYVIIMASLHAHAKLFSAPPIKIEKKPQYEPKLFSQFVRGVKKNEILDIKVRPETNTVYFIEQDGTLSVSEYVPSNEFWKTLIDSKANFEIEHVATPPSPLDFVSLFFMILFFVAIFRMFNQVQGGAPFDMMKKEIDVESEIKTRFEDVQGIDSAKDELEEIVDFLRKPEKFFGTGAKIPKGALLTGKPGTGKTLLARAIAGESSVPFIQCSGSSFVEMFVGVGAKRVRDIFELARQNQPCIVFIDEIDAIGKKRSMNGFASNDEREQTINQLLTEMDGFDNETQIVVVAATNRVDILDEALLRPGRFDRKIQVSLPDVHGREKILEVHSKDKLLSGEVQLIDVARQTTGFSGADLANLMNECAIRAVRECENGIITPEIVEDVYQRIVVGAKGGRSVSGARKARVAYHEAGHAIIGVLMPEYDEVRKVSIIPRGDAGGVTFFQPSTDDIGMFTKEYLLSQIKVALGGHAAEEIVYGKDRVTTGASSDFQQTYQIAREMIVTYGMGSTLGKLNADPNSLSSDMKNRIDTEVVCLVRDCYEEVLNYLKKYRVKLEHLKDILVEEEIVDGSVVYGMIASCDLNCKNNIEELQNYHDALDTFEK